MTPIISNTAHSNYNVVTNILIVASKISKLELILISNFTNKF